MSDNLPADQEAMLRRVALMASHGDSQQKIAGELKISRNTVKKIIDSPECQDIIKQLSDESIQKARQLVQSSSERLAPKVVQAIEDLLDAKDGRSKAEGVKLYFRQVGLDKSDNQDAIGNLVIQLPGGKEEKVIEADYDSVQKPKD